MAFTDYIKGGQPEAGDYSPLSSFEKDLSIARGATDLKNQPAFNFEPFSMKPKDRFGPKDFLSLDGATAKIEDEQTKKAEAEKEAEIYKVESESAFDQIYKDSKGNPVVSLAEGDAFARLQRAAIGNPYLDNFISREGQRLQLKQKAKQARLNQSIGMEIAERKEEALLDRQTKDDLRSYIARASNEILKISNQGLVSREDATKMNKAIRVAAEKNEYMSVDEAAVQTGAEIEVKPRFTKVEKIYDKQTDKTYYRFMNVDNSGRVIPGAQTWTDLAGNPITTDIPDIMTNTSRYTIESVEDARPYGVSYGTIEELTAPRVPKTRISGGTSVRGSTGGIARTVAPPN